MTYDHWKTTDPAEYYDVEPDRPDTRMIAGECDCCGNQRTTLRQCWMIRGLETWACAQCRDDDDDLSEETAS